MQNDSVIEFGFLELLVRSRQLLQPHTELELICAMTTEIYRLNRVAGE